MDCQRAQALPAHRPERNNRSARKEFALLGRLCCPCPGALMRAEGLDLLGICVVEVPVRRLRAIVFRRSPAGAAHSVGRAGRRWASLSGFPRCCWSVSIMRALASRKPLLTAGAPIEGFPGISLVHISVGRLSIVLYTASQKLEVLCVLAPEHLSSQGHVPRRCLEDARAVLCLFSM